MIVFLLTLVSLFAQPSTAKKPAASHSVSLSWTAVSGAVGYIAYRYSNGTTIEVCRLVGTSCVDTNVTTGVVYYYGVVAYAHGGVGSKVSNVIPVYIPTGTVMHGRKI